MKKLNDKLAGFGIEAAIQHALTLNAEADKAHMIILSCGVEAWWCAAGMVEYVELLPYSDGKRSQPKQYPGATGMAWFKNAWVLILPDNSLGDNMIVIHDEDYQWSVTTTAGRP